MRNPWFVFSVCTVILLACVKTPQQAGTMSETDTAMIYNPDYTPAIGATVKFFAATDSTRTVAYQSTTDEKGHYSVSGLTKGSYNMLATKDSLIVFQDSIIALSDTVLIQPDTLMKPGSITGTIGLQPNHDPRTATVQVLGTDLYSNVDINGRFTLSPVAKGNYNLRLVTTLPDYTPTYVTISTQGQKKDTLSDTLWLLYTGIPVVTGLTATYDTVNGHVHLSWNKAAYRDFQRYMIFRDPYNSIVLSATPIATSADTFLVDTVFRRNGGSGTFSFSDTNDYHFEYRVCIENNSTKRGETYKYVDIVAASPGKARTSFAFTFFHIAKKFITDSASINDSLLCCVNLSNPTRQLKSLVWTDVNAGKMVRTVTLDSTKKTAGDTLVYSWNSVGGKRLACVVTDMAGTVWRDTAYIAIVKDDPLVTLAYSPAPIMVQDTIHVHLTVADKYGTIVSIGWDVGNTGNFSPGARMTSVLDTVLVAPGMPNAEYLCVARVADDDGNVVLDSVKINVSIFKLAIDTAAFGIRSWHSSVVFNNKMWVIGGQDWRTMFNSDTWYSVDGISWFSATRQAAFPSRFEHSSLVFSNQMWVIGGVTLYGGVHPLNDVWVSSDGSTWTESTPAAQFSPRWGHTSVLFNNNMWVIAGQDSLSALKNDIWLSPDGITWTQATDNAAFSSRCCHTSLVFDGKMWVIAGNDSSGSRSDVWYSTDGATWTQATANAGFSPRRSHSSVVFDNKMWVIAGQNQDWSGYLSDAWYSTDGVTWIQADSSSGFSPRAGLSSLAFGNKMWVIGGFEPDTSNINLGSRADVWYSGFSAK